MVKDGAQRLPDGWEWKTIGDVTLPIEKVDPKQKPDEGFTYLDIASIDNSVHKITEPKSYYGVDAPSRARQLVQANDVLFSTVRTYLENIAQVPEVYDGQIASTGFSVLRANELVLPKYLFYYSLTQNFLEPLNELQRGTSYPAVRDGDVRIQLIPVAPLPTQERIVSRIEELFSDLEAGVAALERVRAGLRRYKASVLKAACEGKFLENRGIANNGELPEGWRLATLESIALKRRHAISSGPFGSALGRKDYRESGIPVLRGQNIKDGKFHLENLVYVTEEKAQELIRSTAIPGDLVVVAVGSSGQPAIVPENLPRAILSQNCNKITLDNEVAFSKYVVLVMQTDFAQDQLSEKTTDTARPFLSLTNLKKTIIPLPPLDEQRRIVAEVERRLSVVGEVESAVEVGLARSARLRQAVLRSAFEGRLT